MPIYIFRLLRALSPCFSLASPSLSLQAKTSSSLLSRPFSRPTVQARAARSSPKGNTTVLITLPRTTLVSLARDRLSLRMPSNHVQYSRRPKLVGTQYFLISELLYRMGSVDLVRKERVVLHYCIIYCRKRWYHSTYVCLDWKLAVDWSYWCPGNYELWRCRCLVGPVLICNTIASMR